MGYLYIGSPCYKKEIDMEIIRIMIITSIILSVLIIAIGTYLIIVGGNMKKTKKEREYEDEEQMKTVSKTKENGDKKFGKRYL